MRLLKYLFCLVLFTGITMPLLSSCSDDDENGSAIEGYWVTGLEGEDTPEMILFKGGEVCRFVIRQRRECNCSEDEGVGG